jgi:hypothetical protein
MNRPIAPALSDSAPCPSRELSCQLIEEPLRVFQIGGVQAFVEPVVDFDKHGARYVVTAGIPKQPRKADRRSQFPRLRAHFLC